MDTHLTTNGHCILGLVPEMGNNEQNSIFFKMFGFPASDKNPAHLGLTNLMCNGFSAETRTL